VLKLKYHATQQRIKRKMTWATVHGAIDCGRLREYPDGIKIYRWFGVEIVMTEDDHIITVYDAIKNG
jgi:hypothetical protein